MPLLSSGAWDWEAVVRQGLSCRTADHHRCASGIDDQAGPGATRRLLEKHVELTEEIPNLDHSTIGRVLKKPNCALI
ncbi:hypothetical protein FHX82_001733 [Amycolatopsis bartoniae]|uniref:Uncharacterized protein n=1 Tax=Amycolatopsis bartoniae TaxID=941986 RepID=A0A8H9MCL9_9PSEU|nr:hypothetical protein [Amycolatopsis bartoniae]MBB2934713.1 hypothetical protein [Amycolatopsis bartoniae]GHF45309.1 hypothetical protein GCM10017566_17930 [Amycolatopsis bartoniae]